MELTSFLDDYVGETRDRVVMSGAVSLVFVDCLRECCQPPAGARLAPPERDRCPPGDGRKTIPLVRQLLTEA